MCHTGDARPPTPHHTTTLAQAQRTHLTSADGTRFMAYLAQPAEPSGRGVVILPDVRGLHEFYQALARDFARLGITAIAIDYYGRSLPDGPRTEPMAAMLPLVAQLTEPQVAADVWAASETLRTAGVDTVFSVGFCLGGSHSWLQPMFDPRLAGGIGFYGRPSDTHAYLSQLRGPLLLLGAGADMMTSPEEFTEFGEQLTSAGVEHTAVSYAGAPHAFFDQAADAHEAACADAWQQVLRFIDEHSTVQAAS
jgi:carboxymethylenebutenolidase